MRQEGTNLKSIIVADIGATKVRIGIWKQEVGSSPALLRVNRFETSSFASFFELLNTYLKEVPELSWQALAIGVAGPVQDESGVTMTNLNWSIHSEELSHQFNQKPVFLVNDLEAHGHSLSIIPEQDLFCLQKGKKRTGNRALIAVGTGLGEALIVQGSSSFRVSPSEGGHCTFSPFDEQELSLHRFLLSRYPEHVSWERALSGKFGFENLYEFFLRQQSHEKICFSKSGQEDWGPWVCSQAQQGNPVALQALDLFFRLYGREAGNLALKGLSLGGVYVAGGIARKLIAKLSQSQFVMAFSQKGRMSALLKEIPIFVILDPDAPIKGLGQYALKKLEESQK